MSDISAIDRAIAAAQARKAAKLAAGPVEHNAPVPTVMNVPSKVSVVDKSAKNAEREAQRAAQKAERDAARAARKVAKESQKSGRTPHMSKVEKAAAALPPLEDSTQLTFNEITANFSASQITALAAHLQHFNRVKATERALSRTVQEGDTVTVVAGNPKYIGMTGTVTKAQRIRCYVELPGVSKPVYLFTSDVELQTNEALSVAV